MPVTAPLRSWRAATLAAALAAGWAAAQAQAPAPDPMVEFTVVRADTLIGLSSSVLNSPGAWREVARINHLPDANRILPGQRLRIPTRLLRGDAVSATLVSVTGPDVQVGHAPATPGTPLPEGQSVQTGPGSSAVIALADGSRVRVPPSSLAEVAASRRYGDRLPATAAASAEDATAANAPSGWFAGTLRVLRGSVEVFATKVLRSKPLEIVTPTAVVGVRGTEFRVALDVGAEQRSHSELLEGQVRFEAANTPGTTDLQPGYGAAVDASGRPPTVAKLLPAPDFADLPARFERPIVRWTPAQTGTALRVQVAADPNFDQIVADQRVAAGAELRVAGLDDATWYLRARSIDAAGIEGLDGVRPFVLKARPEPPAYLAPRSDAKQTVGTVAFNWAQNESAPRARLQVATDAAFSQLVTDQDNLDAARADAALTTPGTYYWRLASIRPSGDHGPFGDPQRFELRPLPEPPAVGRSADGGLVFTWSGRPQDRQQVEFARDPAFKEIVSKDEVSGSQWNLALPASGGRYYFRYRTVEPDGYVSPYSETLRVDVPRDWSGLGLLLPLVLLF